MRLRTTHLVLSIIVLTTGLTACSKPGPDPNKAVAAFVDGWRSRSFGGAVHFVDADNASLDPATATTDLKGLMGDLATVTPKISSAKAKVKVNVAAAGLTVTLAIDTKTNWTYRTTVHLHLINNVWHVVWDPQTIQPDLVAGGTMRIVYREAERGRILAASGDAIVEARPVVGVGVEPSKVRDINSLVASLDAALRSVGVDIDLADLPDRVAKADPHAFVDVVTLRKQVYDRIRDQIHPLDGTVFNEETRQLAPSKVFAHALLGEVNAVTKERMDKDPGKYHIGDHAGYGGLEQAYEDRLRGVDGVSVVMPGVGSDVDGSPNPSTTLFKIDPIPGQPIKTTIDIKAQNAADDAVQAVTKQSGFIAMRVSTGQVIAVANGPGATGQDLAMEARVPPGSIFKMVTATNVLESGAETTSSIVPCPKALTVEGRTFTNSEGEVLGAATLLTDFAKSCNTAFASLYPKLGVNGLATTAKQLGIGRDWSLGVATFTGSTPDDGSAVDQAAAAFGQGKTLVSPVAMCSAVTAVASGTWKAPTLVTDPAPSAEPAAGTALKPSTVDSMKTMMHAVVTTGTAAKRMAGTPGGPVYAKTGTAQYDNDPNHTHAWFIGYQGDIAFAVLVVQGGYGASAAAPVAKAFLTAMAN